MVVLAHCVDILNPIRPTDIAVSKAQMRKWRILVEEGIVAESQRHQFDQISQCSLLTSSHEAPEAD